MDQFIKTFVDYNLWANQELLAIFSSIDQSVFEQKIISSYSSIQSTMLHIWNAETIWLNRLEGKTLSFLPSKDFKGTKEALMDGILACSLNFKTFVHAQPKGFSQKIIAYQTVREESFQEPTGIIIHHCMNHSTYHRGQLVTMANQIQLKTIPSTDLMTYARLAS